jgi:Sulfotransferase family
MPRMGDHRFVFVGGLHRSGTSMLARCLAEHPDVSGFHDTGVPEDEGQHLQDVYPAANRLGGAGRFAFSPLAHLTEDSPLVTERNRRRLFEQWSRHWDLERPVLLEKSPPNVTRTRFLQAMFPQSQFVIVTRHPVAVALATSKWTRSTVPRMIEHWLRCHETLLEDAPRLAHLTVLRYEDFVADPQIRLAELQAFLDLPPHPVEVPLRPGLNDAYFAAWERRRRNPLRRLLLDRSATRLDERVRRFGYALSPPRVLATVATASAGSTHNGE